MPGVKLTYEDLVRLPDDGMRHELIDGEHFVTPKPMARHQLIAGDLQSTLHQYVKEHGLGWIVADTDFRIDDFSVVEPDIAFVPDELTDGLDIDEVLRITPALIVEVSSPSTRRYDQTVKRDFYASIKVQEYWFVDVPATSVWIYRRQPDTSSFDAPVVVSDPDAVVATPLIPGLSLRLADIFTIRRRERR